MDEVSGVIQNGCAASSTDEHTKQSSILPSEEEYQPRTDGRITNKGSLERRYYTNTEKVMLMDEVSGAIHNGFKNAQEYFTDAGYTYELARQKTNNYNKWKADAVYTPALWAIVLEKTRANAKSKRTD